MLCHRREVVGCQKILHIDRFIMVHPCFLFLPHKVDLYGVRVLSSAEFPSLAEVTRLLV